MKIFTLVCIAFTMLVTRVTCKEEKKNKVSNNEISDMLKHILKRLDKIEENVQANRDGTKEVRNEVKANREVLLKLDLHVRDQQMKLKEVTAITEEERREIAANTRSVKELSQAIDVTLRNISKDVSEVKAVLTEVLPGKTEGKPAKSCPWIKNRSYCARSGHFWIKDDGKPLLQFCNMDENEPVTTVAPTTTHPTTTAHPSSTVPPTTQPIYRGASCKELKNCYPHLMTGIYNITVGGSTFEVFCDMETDNGGWTMVGKAVVKKESEAKEVHYETIQRDDFRQLHNVTTGRFLLSTKGLNSLYDIHKFTELRFQCFKPYYGRHLDVKTKGSFVLEWLLERRSDEPHPPSCGSFTPLHNDQSFLGQHCENWGLGEWWTRPIYDIPIMAYEDGGLHQIHHAFSLNYNWHYNYKMMEGYNSLFCDDYYDHPNYSHKGSWSFYIR